jgi:hypothetical protein
MIGSSCLSVSPERLLRSLRQIQRHTVHVGHHTYQGLTRPSAEQLELLKAVGVEVPKTSD